MAIQLDLRRISVNEYHRMADTGILTEDDRVELLNGQIVNMSPIGSKHAACVEKIDELLKTLLIGKAMVRAQNPIQLSDYSEPEPDIAIVKRREDYYASRHPVTEEILLIIEVADSSLETDQQVKLPLYAASQIPEYWIVNLEKQQVEVYQSPVTDQYRSRYLFLPDDKISVGMLGIEIRVSQLLP